MVKLEFDATEKEKDAQSSSSSLDSHDGRTDSAGAAGGDGVLAESLSRAELRDTFLFFRDDVMTVSCLCSSGTTAGWGWTEAERGGGVFHGFGVLSSVLSSRLVEPSFVGVAEERARGGLCDVGE